MLNKSKIGILLSHLGASQQAFKAITEINRMIAMGLDGVLFYENLVMPCIRPSCAAMCINEIINFDGILVVNSIYNMSSISRSVNCAKTAFYVWDLEWLRSNNSSFLYNLKAFNAADKLISRSYDHARLIKNYSNRMPTVEPEFDLEKIIGLF
jgi:hypothetical protein